MADTFKLCGTYSTQPTSGSPSADPEVVAPIEEAVGLIRKSISTLDLAADAPVAVGFGGLTNVHVLVVRTVGGKIRLRVTTADGATQAIPVDPFHATISLTVPITAIDVTRVAGQATTVKVFLGERA